MKSNVVKIEEWGDRVTLDCDMKTFKQRNGIIQFIFWKDHYDNIVEIKLRMDWETGKSVKDTWKEISTEPSGFWRDDEQSKNMSSKRFGFQFLICVLLNVQMSNGISW
jgi:hypothetical protein